MNLFIFIEEITRQTIEI